MRPLPLKKAVIDTGPLFAFLTLVFIQKRPGLTSTLRHKHNLTNFLPDPTSERNFFEYLDNIPLLLTTSHVVGEMRSRHKVSEDLHADFWLCAMEYLSRKSFAEKQVTLLDLYQAEPFKNIACNLGPTDAGLIYLARQEACELLTHDERMLAWQPADGQPLITLIHKHFSPLRQ